MAFSKKTWVDRNVEHPARRKLSLVSGTTDVYDVTRNEGTINNPGDAFNADNMNDLEDRISNSFTSIEENDKPTTGILSAGATTITLYDERIATNSILSFVSSIYGANPTAVSSGTGYVTLTFDAQSSEMTVGVKVEGTY